MTEVKEKAKLLSKVSGLTPLWEPNGKSKRGRSSRRQKLETILEFAWTPGHDTSSSLKFEMSQGRHTRASISFNNGRSNINDGDSLTLCSGASSSILVSQNHQDATPTTTSAQLPGRYFSDRHGCFCCHEPRSEQYHRQHRIKAGDALKPSLCQFCIRVIKAVPRLKRRELQTVFTYLSQFHWCRGCGTLRSTSFHNRYPVGGKASVSDLCATCEGLAGAFSASNTGTLFGSEDETINRKQPSASLKHSSKFEKKPVHSHNQNVKARAHPADPGRVPSPGLKREGYRRPSPEPLPPKAPLSPLVQPMSIPDAQTTGLSANGPQPTLQPPYPPYLQYQISHAYDAPMQNYYNTDDVNPFQPHPGHTFPSYDPKFTPQSYTTHYHPSPAPLTSEFEQTTSKTTRTSTKRSILRRKSITTEGSSSHIVRFSNPEISGSTTVLDYDRTPIWGPGLIPPTFLDELDIGMFGAPRDGLRGPDISSNQRATEYCAGLDAGGFEDWSVGGHTISDDEVMSGWGDEEYGVSRRWWDSKRMR
ncbi:hypothetical protein OQA88_6770 [Cercophora sp. LCS_1]